MGLDWHDLELLAARMAGPHCCAVLQSRKSISLVLAWRFGCVFVVIVVTFDDRLWVYAGFLGLQVILGFLCLSA
jgi:hypothetical protein